MRKTKLACAALLGVVWATSPGSLLADQGVSGLNTINPDQEVTVTTTNFYLHAAHVANGIVLRNRTSGTISLRGVPARAAIRRAYLYWNFSDTSRTGPATSGVLFNGNSGSGVKMADNIDPCWGLTGNHTYRRDVTTLIPLGTPNEDYEVTASTSGITAGGNPWLPTVTGKKFEGATLVVIYTVSAATAVVIYDALSGTEFSGTSLFVTLLNPISLSGAGLFTMAGADGQRGSGHDNTASNETGFFNGPQISGPPVANSDWDGSAGLPLPQLFDVHTHNVSVANPSSLVRYVAGTDCLVPVVFVVQANNP